MKRTTRWAFLVAALVLLGPAASADVGFFLAAKTAIDLGDWTLEPGLPSVGAEARVGDRFQNVMPLFDPVPELALTYLHFPSDADSDATLNVVTIRAGIDLLAHSFPVPFAPTLGAHVGYGFMTGSGPDYTYDLRGLAWDVGLGVELDVTRYISVGLRFDYQAIVDFDPPTRDGSPESTSWMEIGLYVRVFLEGHSDWEPEH